MNQIGNHQPIRTRLCTSKFHHRITAALSSEIQRRFDIEPEVLHEELVEAAAGLVICGKLEKTDSSPAERLVNNLHLANELTPAIAVKALRQGQVAVFEHALAKLTHLPVMQVRRIMFDPSGEGLAVVCRAIDLNRAAFDNVP